MMKVVEQKNSILKSFKLFDHLFVQGKNEGESFKNVVFVEDKYELFHSECLVYRYLNDDLQLFDFERAIFYLNFEGSNYVVGASSSNSEYLIFLLASNKIKYFKNGKEQFCFEFDKDISVFFNQFLITTSGFSLTKKNSIQNYQIYNLRTPLWHFTFPEGFTLYKQIQLVGNVLFFKAYIANGDLSKVYGMELNSGKILWEYSYHTPFKENHIAFLINPANNLSYGYGGSLYQVFDPVNGKMLVQKDMEDYYNKGILPDLHRQSISESKLWFVSGRGESVKFGALNIETSEIEFVQDFPLEQDEQLDTPIFHQGRLYLRGLHYNKLWILE